MSLVNRKCKLCKSGFLAKPSEVKRGGAKFCSEACAHKGKKKPKPKSPNVSCAMCDKRFYKNKSKQKASKSGLFFCCRACKDSAQRIGGIKEIMPPHYGNGEGIKDYRKIAFKHHPKECADCGWDEIPEVLEVHHVDGDRRNNCPENLLPVCGRCHDIRHFLSKTGKWASQSK